MTQDELTTKDKRAKEEPLIVTETDQGFRVHSPAAPTRVYVVTGAPHEATCTCPDFQYNASDPNWQCKHVVAVMRRFDFPPASPDAPTTTPEADGVEPTTLLLKRSVSPDGRIDSLSVEFSAPVNGVPVDTILARARTMLGLQNDIAGIFLNGQSKGRTELSRNGNGNGNGAVGLPARLIDIQSIQTKRGRKMCINVEVDGGVSYLFGNRQQLAAAISAAGFPDRARQIDEGTLLDLPCRAITKPSTDGRYINIDKVLPINGHHGNGAPSRGR